MRFPSSTVFRRLTGHRSTRLTSEGGQFLLFTLAIGIAAINTGNNLFYLILAMMLSFILVSGIVAEYGLRRLEFHRHLPELLFVNEPVTAILVIKNQKSTFPSFSLRVFDVCEGHEVDRGIEISQLLPGTSRLVSYPLIATRRGRLRLEAVCVATAFPFGLFVKKAYYPVEGTTVVCPEIKPLEDGWLREHLTVGQEHSLPRRGQGNELYNLRLYQTGDDSRSIHWPTTARTSKLIIRETEAEDQRRASVHLLTSMPDGHYESFEQAVSFTASLVQHLAQRGYVLQLVVGSMSSSHGQGDAHLMDLLRMLALCEATVQSGNASETLDPLPNSLDDEGGVLLTVNPWCGTVGESTGDPTVLINGEIVRGPFYVV